jgi:hypothetical protein
MKAEAPWLIILDRVDEDEGQLLVQTTLPAVWKSYADGEIGALGGVSCGWGWRGAGVANPTERGRDFAGHQTGGVGRWGGGVVKRPGCRGRRWPRVGTSGRQPESARERWWSAYELLRSARGL